MTDPKTITVGSDHAGYGLKLKVIDHLKELGYKVIDVGTDSEASCDYPVFAHRVCKNIQDGVTKLGILVCGTGVGMSIAANKHRGIRAAVCSDTFSARLCSASASAWSVPALPATWWMRSWAPNSKAASTPAASTSSAPSKRMRRNSRSIYS